MTDLEQIQNTLNSLKNILDDTQDIVNELKQKPQPIKWYPVHYEKHVYAHVDSKVNGRTCGFQYPNHESALQAEEQIIQYSRMLKFAFECNNGWEPDWYDLREQKWFVYYHHNSYSISSSTRWHIPTGIYFKHREDAQKLANMLNNNEM